MADQFEVADLRTDCEETILQKIDASNVIEIYNLGHFHKSEKLKQAAFETIQSLFPGNPHTTYINQSYFGKEVQFVPKVKTKDSDKQENINVTCTIDSPHQTADAPHEPSNDIVCDKDASEPCSVQGENHHLFHTEKARIFYNTKHEMIPSVTQIARIRMRKFLYYNLCQNQWWKIILWPSHYIVGKICNIVKTFCSSSLLQLSFSRHSCTIY